MVKKIMKLYSSLNNIFKNQSFKEKPIRTLLYIFLTLVFLIFRVKKKYKVKVNSNKNFFLYIYKPYLSMGMGGRGQYVLREYYDPFFIYANKFLPTKFNFIDIGCSRGFFSLFLLSLNNNEERKGICIDPFDYALNDFKEILSLNKLSNVKILKGVVSDKSSEKTFLHNIKTPSESSIIKKKHFTNNEGFFCKSYTVDELIYSMNLIKSVEFIKVDSEGSEYEILLGSKKTLQNMRPLLYLEITRKSEEIKKILLEYNYSIHTVKNGNLISNNEKIISTSILAKPKN